MAPTLATDNELIDALLWIKTPGESDGECTRGLVPAGETIDPEFGLIDPEFGLIDPAAGAWFPEQVLDLISYADPALAGEWPHEG
jgi:endoglucanase